jgi:WXG100 family type VII secretion target
MASHKIQCDYNQLGDHAKKFKAESDQTKQLFQAVNNVVQQLEGGDWIGEGAKKFFEEMQDLTNPGIDRLVNALEDASSAAQKVSDALSQAENESGACFQ